MFFAHIRKLTILAALALTLFVPAAASAAYNPFAPVDCTRARDSAVCQGRGNTTDPLTGTQGVFVKATNIIAWVGGVMAVIFMVVGGIKYITAGGAPGEVQKAKDTIIYAFVGLIAIVLARQVITFVLSRV